MSNKDKIWNAIERYAKYVAIGIFILAELLSTFIPAVRGLMDSGGSFFLIGIVLYAILRILDEKLPEAGTERDLVAHSFGDMIDFVKGNEEHIKEIVIFAHTGIIYYNYIKEMTGQGIKIDKIRLLINEPRHVMTRNPTQNDIDSLQSEFNTSMGFWSQLNKNENIGSLEIRKFFFYPSFHFIIVDGKRAGLGLFLQNPQRPGTYKVIDHLQHFVLLPSPRGKHFIADLEEFFNTIYKSDEFSDGLNVQNPPMVANPPIQK